MNLRKILSKVVTAALIVTTVGVVEPAKAYAADIAYEWIDVDGTNEWKVNKDFSAEFTIDSKTTTGTKNNNLTCTYALYDGETRVYHSTLGKKYKLDKTKNYTLQVYVFDSTGNNYFDSVERGYINGLNVYKQTSSDTDPYFNITTEQTCFEITKKLTYVPLINAFVVNDNYLDAGDVTIVGPGSWKPGDTFDGSKYKATAETGLPLYVTSRLEDKDGNILYDSEDKTKPVKLEKGKWYKRWIFIHVGNSERSDYAFGDTGKVKINGREYKHGFGPDKWSIEIESWMNYFKTVDSISDLPDELDLGVVSIDGTLDWCDGEKFIPDVKVKSSEEYRLNKHVRLFKGEDKELVYDSNDAKYSNYTIKEGESYSLTVYVSIDNGNSDENENWGFCWVGNIDALLVNGKSIKDYNVIDDSNTIEYTYSFVGGKAKPTEPKNDQPKVETKKKQKAKVKAKSKTLKVKKAKKGLKLEKLITVKNAKGKVTYKIKSSKPKKGFKINKKGVITLKKKLSKGSYNLKVTVTAAGNKEYKKFSKTVTVKIKVK